MLIQTYTRMPMYSLLETSQLVGVNLYHLSGPGNGDLQSPPRTEEAVGEIPAVYVVATYSEWFLD
jgi:hypothetical protein